MNESFMNCQQFENTLSLWIAEEQLTSRELALQLQTHAQECIKCQHQSALVELLIENQYPSDGLGDPKAEDWNRMRRNIKQALNLEAAEELTTGHKASKQPWLYWAAAAVLVVVAWVGVSQVFFSDGESQPSARPVVEANIPLDFSDIEPEVVAETVSAWEFESWELDVWVGASPIPDTESLSDDERDALWQWLEEDNTSSTEQRGNAI